MICEGINCTNEFKVNFEGQRRCKQCHKKNVQYKDGTVNERIKKNKKIHRIASKTKYVRLLKAVNRTGLVRCAYCGTDKDLTVDHIKPLSQGGGNNWGNLQTLCGTCNTKKSVKEGNSAPLTPLLTTREEI